MSQFEIYAFLKKHPNRRFDVKELEKYIPISYVSISRSVKKLYKKENIEVQSVWKAGRIYKNYIIYKKQ